METAVKLAAMGIVAALCAAVVRRREQEIGLVLGLGAASLILSAGLGAFSGVLALMEELTAAAELSPAVVGPVVKTVGTAILTRVAAAFCRDAGEGGIASAVELCGTALALSLTLPLLRAVLTTLLELL